MQIRAFEDYVEKANAAQDENELFQVFLGALKNHGIDRAFFCLATDHHDLGEKAGMGVMRNYPEDWMKYYFEKGFDKIDPVLIYSLSHNDAFYWDDISKNMKLTRQQATCLNYGREAGLYNGMCVPMRGPDNQMAGIGLATSEKTDAFDGKIDLINAYSNHFYIAYKRLKKLPSVRVDNIALSPREREIVLWMCKGKTEAEIGMILGLSANTVSSHFKSIFKKLNVHNKVMAAVVAITKGLVQL